MENIIELVIHWVFHPDGQSWAGVHGGAGLARSRPSPPPGMTRSSRQGADAFPTGLTKILDKVALNPPADKARKP